MPKAKPFKDLKAGSLKTVHRPYELAPGNVRVVIAYAKDDILILEGPIKKNYDLIDLAELSEE